MRRQSASIERTREVSETDLDSDVTSSNDGDALGLFLERKEAVAGDTVLGALYVRVRRLTSNGNNNPVRLEDVLGSIGPLHLNLVLALEPGEARVVVDVVLLKVALVNAVEAADIGVTLALERLPVKGDRLLGGGLVEPGDAETVRVGVAKVLGDGGCVPHHLLEAK